MTDEQRRLFRETQAVMSLLEGFSDYVMDEVGRDLVPGVERISARFHERRAAADAVRAGDAPAHRHGPQDGAVPEGRGVRAGPSRDSRGDGRAARGCGTAPRRCRATARSSDPSAGSAHGSSTAGWRWDPAASAAASPRRDPDRGPGRGPAVRPPAIALSPILVGPLPRRATSSASARRRPGRGS